MMSLHFVLRYKMTQKVFLKHRRQNANDGYASDVSVCITSYKGLKCLRVSGHWTYWSTRMYTEEVEFTPYHTFTLYSSWLATLRKRGLLLF